MTFYSTLQSKATLLLAKFGRDVTLRKVTAPGAYDPATGTVAPTTTDYTLKGALFDVEGQTEKTETLEHANDKRALLQAGGAVPTVDDMLLVGGVLYSVLGPVKELNPAGTPVIYELRLRR